MQVNVIIFGQLCELLGDSLTLHNIDDTESLVAELNKKHPSLAEMKYAMAVDKKVVTGNVLLSNGCTVALLPPFSGG